MNEKFLWCIIILVFMASCVKDIAESDVLEKNLLNRISASSPTKNYNHFVLPGGGQFGDIPQDIKNPLTSSKVLLGKFLFYETAFARDPLKAEGIATYSCSSCHIAEAGFRANRPQGIADGGSGFGQNGESRVRNRNYEEDEIDVQSARPISLINVAYVTNTFWNGQFGRYGANEDTEDVWSLREDTERNFLGFDGIETVNFEGLFTHRIKVDSQSVLMFGYQDLFDEAFDDYPVQERYNNKTASLALSAYIRTLISDQAPFQKWLKGEKSAMTSSMKKGAILFFGKANCSNCHYQPNLGSEEFHALGVKDMYQRPSYNAFADDRRNLGRGGFTLREQDYYKFKVPGLYNVGDSPWYFHGASKTTLDEVLDYKIEAKSENSRVNQDRISSKLRPLDLTIKDKSDLLEFLNYALRDPELTRYVPNEVLSGNCFPNADLASKYDKGCN